jgi:hypothetical protein
MKRIIPLLVLGLVLPSAARGYPLDGYETTGITRLIAYSRAREPLLAHGTLVPGSLWTMEEVKLRLEDTPGFMLPDPDPGLTAEIREMLGRDAAHYGLALLDVSDPARPRYAELNGRTPQQPGSVGKIAVALAWFHALAEAHPTDIEARRRILREAQITANEFIVKDEHDIPMWRPGDPKLKARPIQQGDRENVYTFLDWMLSPSANAAASMIQYHLILLKHFGTEYPVSEERAQAFFARASPAELQRIYASAMMPALKENGLDPERLRQGSFFTSTGRSRMTSIGSNATARELLRFLVLMEQGKLVDPWSSLELKRLLYLTQRRVRYAASPALAESGVYFKSGSLFSCKPEPGFACEKYRGNVKNFMNSVAIVETRRPGRPPLHYLVAVLSNVLRKDSKEIHEELARRIHGLIEAHHTP